MLHGRIIHGTATQRIIINKKKPRTVTDGTTHTHTHTQCSSTQYSDKKVRILYHPF
jgi:hypothetical protein